MQKKVAGLKPIRVFDYDSGEAAPFTGPGLATVNALIELGGGTNIFSGLKQSWTSVSWEQVTADQPQCIIINDYGTPDSGAEGEVPGDEPDHQEPPRGQEPLFLAAQLRRGHPGPRNAGAVVAHRSLVAPERVRPACGRVMTSEHVVLTAEEAQVAFRQGMAKVTRARAVPEGRGGTGYMGHRPHRRDRGHRHRRHLALVPRSSSTTHSGCGRWCRRAASLSVPRIS